MMEGDYGGGGWWRSGGVVMVVGFGQGKEKEGEKAE